MTNLDLTLNEEDFVRLSPESQRALALLQDRINAHEMMLLLMGGILRVASPGQYRALVDGLTMCAQLDPQTSGKPRPFSQALDEIVRQLKEAEQRDASEPPG